MKTTNDKIQALCRFGKIAALLFTVYCLVMTVICVALMIIHPETLTVAPLNLMFHEEEYFEQCIEGLFFYGHETILGFMAFNYFRIELEEGTPFTFEGAHELMVHGVVGIILAVVADVAAHMCLKSSVPGFDLPFALDWEGFVSRGVLCIGLSLVCKLGAEKFETEE
ncbi:MAG: hypothetical protein Q4D13_08375 [Erysipelotrichaceae bacterium]|nr:hypothetical protein [Erysipelotrichaceae bacterium]